MSVAPENSHGLVPEGDRLTLVSTIFILNNKTTFQNHRTQTCWTATETLGLGQILHLQRNLPGLQGHALRKVSLDKHEALGECERVE